MPERPSTVSTCTNSPRIASRRSIRRAAVNSPRSRRPAARSVTRGLTWCRRDALWVRAEYRDRKIHQIDPQTGAVLRTIESNRFVTGVTWVDGDLWHGTWEGDESDLRRIDPRTGEVLESLEMPPGTFVFGSRVRRRQSVLLRRGKERENQSFRPPAQAISAQLRIVPRNPPPK